MLRKIITAALAVILILTVFTSCGKGSGTQEAVTTQAPAATEAQQGADPVEFYALMDSILAVNAGSAGASLRTEDTVARLAEYAAKVGAAGSGAFETLANEWFAKNKTVSPTDFKENLDAVSEFDENLMTDVAVLNIINGIGAAVETAASAVSEEETVSAAENEPGKAGIASLDELNNVIGSKLCRPAVMGVSNEEFEVISVNGNQVCEYRFTLNGITYSFRASDTFDDITGIYEDGDTDYPTSNDMAAFKTTENYKLAWWETGYIQYAFIVKDDGTMEPETFKGFVEEIKSNIV